MKLRDKEAMDKIEGQTRLYDAGPGARPIEHRDTRGGLGGDSNMMK